MSLADELRALREGVVVAPAAHIVQLRLRGTHAFDMLERAFARELYVQDGQLLHGLFLTGAGGIFADVYVGRDEDDFVVLSEGPPEPDLIAYLEDCRPAGAPDSTVHGIDDASLGLHGPYAWELLADILGPEVIGLPYLTFYRDGDLTVHRIGQTGEFGYLLRTSDGAGLRARIEEAGSAFDLREASLETLDRAAFESFFFCIRDPNLAALDPVTLQLQWRLGGAGAHVGADAIRRPTPRRLALARVDAAVDSGAVVALEGAPVGRVVTCAETPTLRDLHATLLLDRRWAHPGLVLGVAGVSVTTVTPPPVRPRSLFVNPQRHAYATRSEVSFPPLLAARVR